MSDVVIRLQNAVVLLGRFPALSGLDLEVSKGEVVLTSGPNGAGKTTLLRLLAGLLNLTSGEGEIYGQDLKGSKDKLRSQSGLLSLNSMLYEDLTLMENLRFWSSFVSPNNSKNGAIEEAFSYLELSPKLWNLGVRHFSTGQKRRAALALLVLRRPRLWLLDEPHAGLDKRARNIVDDLISRASSSGATVILASHETERASQLASRQLELRGGRFVESD